MRKFKSVMLALILVVSLFTMFALPVAAAETAEQDGIKASLSTSAEEYTAKDEITASIEVENKSDSDVNSITVKPKLPEGMAVKENTAEKAVLDLKAGKKDTASFIVVISDKKDTSETKPVTTDKQPPDTGDNDVTAICLAIVIISVALAVFALKGNKKAIRTMCLMLTCLMLLSVVPMGTFAAGNKEITVDKKLSVDGKDYVISFVINYGSEEASTENTTSSDDLIDPEDMLETETAPAPTTIWNPDDVYTDPTEVPTTTQWNPDDHTTTQWNPDDYDTTTVPSYDSDPLTVPSTKAEIAAAYNKAVNDAKNYTGKVVLKKHDIIDVQLKDMPPIAEKIITPVIQNLTTTSPEEYIFENGHDVNDPNRMLTHKIIPNGRNAEVSKSSLAKASAKANADGGYTMVLKFIAETSNFDGTKNTSEPVEHNKAMDPFNLGTLDLGPITISDAAMRYPGATLTATVDNQGRLVKLVQELPFEGEATGKGAIDMTMKLAASMGGTYELSYDGDISTTIPSYPTTIVPGYNNPTTAPVTQERTTARHTTTALTTEGDYPVPSSTKQVLKRVTKYINQLKAEQNMKATKKENITVNLTDLSVAAAKNVVQGIIDNLAGAENMTYTFSGGHTSEGVTPNDVIPPSNKAFGLTSAGVASAKVEKVGKNTVYTIVLVEESTTLKKPIPTHNASAIGYLDLSSLSLPSAMQITKADMKYPGSTVTVTVNPNGKVIGLKNELPLTCVCEAKIIGMSGSFSLAGALNEEWTFTY